MVALLFSLFALSQLVVSGPVVRRATLAASCDSNTKALALGLQNNIAVQYQELSISNQMSNTLAADTVDSKAFQEQKTELYNTVKKGMEIRENNQKIPNSNQAVTEGLNKVANAQILEMKATGQLDGSEKAQTANLVRSLQAAFEGGVKENSNTLTQVLSQCSGGPSNNGLGTAQALESIIQNNGNNGNNQTNGNNGNNGNNGMNGNSQLASSNSTNSTAGSPTGTSGKNNQKSPTPTGSSTKNQDSSSRKGSSKDQNMN